MSNKLFNVFNRKYREDFIKIFGSIYEHSSGFRKYY